MQRKCLDLALDEREETVSLLLREYESSDADWLWQTNAKLVLPERLGALRPRDRPPCDELEGLSIVDLIRTVPRTDQSVRRRRSPRRRRRSIGARAFTELVVPLPGRRRGPQYRAFGAPHLQQAAGASSAITASART